MDADDEELNVEALLTMSRENGLSPVSSLKKDAFRDAPRVQGRGLPIDHTSVFRALNSDITR